MLGEVQVKGLLYPLSQKSTFEKSQLTDYIENEKIRNWKLVPQNNYVLY